MTVLQAHFDGKVFVPNEPPRLSPGSVTLHVVEPDTDVDPLTGLPVVRVPPGTKSFTPDDVRRAMDEDD